MDSSATSTDNLLKFLAWLDRNKKRVSLISAAVLAAAGLVAAIFYYQSQKEIRASEALSNVRKPFNPASPLPENVVEAYLKVAREFDGTKAAGRALIEAASLFYIEGKYAEAETQYKRFLNDYPDSSFQPQGMLGLASTVDAEGKTADAIEQYEKVRKRYPNDSVVDEAKLALARLYEKQNPSEAYKLYSELLAMGSQSGVGSEAGIRVTDLLEKYPDLAKTSAPPSSALAPVQPGPQTITPAMSNAMRMAMTNFSNRPGTNPALISASTGVTATAPLLLKPTISTNKP